MKDWQGFSQQLRTDVGW